MRNLNDIIICQPPLRIAHYELHIKNMPSHLFTFHYHYFTVEGGEGLQIAHLCQRATRERIKTYVTADEAGRSAQDAPLYALNV